MTPNSSLRLVGRTRFHLADVEDTDLVDAADETSGDMLALVEVTKVWRHDGPPRLGSC